MRPEQIGEVLSRTRGIAGWFRDEAAMLFGWVDEVQRRHGVEGDLFEIGVHHGRSATLLGKMLRPDEALTVCDLFGDQAGNSSASGRGNLDIFQRNMAAVAGSDLKLRIIQKNSAALDREECGQSIRFFHIDGGHHCHEARADLRLAAACLNARGVIAVDDPYNPQFPGVTEAIIRFLDDHPQFRALMLGFNKMLLVQKEACSLYESELRRREVQEAYNLVDPWATKELPFHGSPLLIFYVPNHVARQPLTLALRSLYRQHRWLHSPLLRPAVAVAKGVVKQRSLRRSA